MSTLRTSEESTSPGQVTRFLEELEESKRRYAKTSLGERILLAEACAEGVAGIAREWVEAACGAKAIPPGSPARAEEVFAGPVAALRHLRLLVHTLRGIETTGTPQLPGKPYPGPNGRLRVPLFADGRLV